MMFTMSLLIMMIRTNIATMMAMIIMIIVITTTIITGMIIMTITYADEDGADKYAHGGGKRVWSC